MIEITNEQIERVNLLLGDLHGAPNRVLFNVINRALGTVRSQSGKEIRQTYNIKQGDITANQNMKMKRATAGDLVGSIEFAGTVIPLKRFKVSPSAPAQKTVSVSVLEHAFVADLGKYGVGVFERMTRRRDSSEQLFGPSTAHMMANENVLDKVEEAAQDTIDKRVEHEITRILNGYGR